MVKKTEKMVLSPQTTEEAKPAECGEHHGNVILKVVVQHVKGTFAVSR